MPDGPPGEPRPGMRLLVAGMGNLLHRDDGIGVRVIETLEAEGGLPEGVRLREVGIGGMHLVQDLMEGWDGLILVDAVDRGDAPGAVRILRPEVPAVGDLAEDDRGRLLSETHHTVPSRVLTLARALDVLPDRVYLVGCQPLDVELGLELSAEVEAATRKAAARVRELVHVLVEGGRVVPADGTE